MEGKSMIELVDGYYIEVDPLCYTLKNKLELIKKERLFNFEGGLTAKTRFDELLEGVN